MANIPVFGLGGTFGSPVLVPDGTDALPGLAFSSDTDLGLVYVAANTGGLNSNEANRFQWRLNEFRANDSAGVSILNEASSATNPTVVPNRADLTTGIGAQASGNFSGIVGGAEITRHDANGFYMVSGNVRFSTTAGITASTTQTQGQQPLTTTVNEVATVAVANDVVTMPAATAGRWVVIINNGASTLQIFPASGDNFAGSAADASVTLASGSKVQYVTYDDAEWESI